MFLKEKLNKEVDNINLLKLKILLNQVYIKYISPYEIDSSSQMLEDIRVLYYQILEKIIGDDDITKLNYNYLFLEKLISKLLLIKNNHLKSIKKGKEKLSKIKKNQELKDLKDLLGIMNKFINSMEDFKIDFLLYKTKKVSLKNIKLAQKMAFNFNLKTKEKEKYLKKILSLLGEEINNQQNKNNKNSDKNNQQNKNNKNSDKNNQKNKNNKNSDKNNQQNKNNKNSDKNNQQNKNNKNSDKNNQQNKNNKNSDKNNQQNKNSKNIGKNNQKAPLSEKEKFEKLRREIILRKMLENSQDIKKNYDRKTEIKK